MTHSRRYITEEASQPAGSLESPTAEMPEFEEHFVIEGGRRLQGAVTISGAKNATLPMLAAALLTEEPVTLDDVPDIEDVHILIEVLQQLGASVEWIAPHRVAVRAANVCRFDAPSDLVRKMRGSFLVMGPLLARFGEAASCAPGGDVIGQRPIDVHLVGFAALGATISSEGDLYVARTSRLKGSEIFIDYPSHIGTENILMAAVLASGTTIIKNASCEPEVADLASLLNKMGARISGAGTSTIVVHGVDRLGGARHRVIPDRIEAGTFAVAAAITAGDVLLENVDHRHLDGMIWKLRESGAEVHLGEDTIHVKSRGLLRAVNVQALPYPGFATDMQSAIGVLLTQAAGQSIVHERVYDQRLTYFNELRKMGADVEVRGQTAVIRGPRKLMGTRVRALDIRSGAALILAGLVGEGLTEVLDIYHVVRGYEGIDTKLRGLGAKIDRKCFKST